MKFSSEQGNHAADENCWERQKLYFFYHSHHIASESEQNSISTIILPPPLALDSRSSHEIKFFVLIFHRKIAQTWKNLLKCNFSHLKCGCLLNFIRVINNFRSFDYLWKICLIYSFKSINLTKFSAIIRCKNNYQKAFHFTTSFNAFEFLDKQRKNY